MPSNPRLTRLVAWGVLLCCVAGVGFYLWNNATRSYQSSVDQLLLDGQTLVDATSRRIRDRYDRAIQTPDHFVVRHAEYARNLRQPQESSSELIRFGEYVLADFPGVQAFVLMGQDDKIYVKSDAQFIPEARFRDRLERSALTHVTGKSWLLVEDGRLLLDTYVAVPGTDLYFILRRSTEFLSDGLFGEEFKKFMCSILVEPGDGSELVFFPSRPVAAPRDTLLNGSRGLPISEFDLPDVRFKVMAIPDSAVLGDIWKDIVVPRGLIGCFVLLGTLLPMGLLDRIYRAAASRSESLLSENALLQYQSLHDPLTNSANRTLLDERLGQAILAGQRTGEMFALMIIDLDKFKPVNDTLGHAVGDILLQEIAERLREPLRETDTIARIGGDEFAALVRIESRDQVALVAGKLLDQFDQLFEVGGTMLAMTASIGVTVFPDHGRSGSELLEHADMAMYQAKSVGSQFAVYNAKFDPNVLDRLALIGSLREAITNDELTLFYQPKISVKDGSLVGLEALVRWQHPKHGMLMPSDFLPLAEQSGVIRLLTEKTIQRALSTCARLNLLGHRVTIAVNLAPRAIHNCDFPKSTRSMLKEWNVQPDQLSFEVTEGSSVPDTGPALAVLQELHEMGIRLSIDDFGMGYSALSYLKLLPVDELKIDKSFVLSMMDDARDAAVVQSTIELAHRFGFDVVAEGVETRAVYDELAKFGCDIVQGTLLSKPMDEQALEEWLEKGM